MPKKKKITQNQVKIAAIVVSSFTFLWVLYEFFTGQLGGFFYYELLRRFGHTAIIMMLLSSLTALFKKYRVPEGWYPHKVFGLFAVLYATAHMLVFWVSYGFDFALILNAITIQQFIILGNIAWILLLIIEVTSIDFIRRKNLKLWRAIHYFYYGAVVAVVIHVAMAAKIVRPIVYFYAVFFLVFTLFHFKFMRKLILKKK
jgi:methionine sulfoxide reductase heme-binding subunit